MCLVTVARHHCYQRPRRIRNRLTIETRLWLDFVAKKSLSPTSIISMVLGKLLFTQTPMIFVRTLRTGSQSGSWSSSNGWCEFADSVRYVPTPAQRNKQRKVDNALCTGYFFPGVSREKLFILGSLIAFVSHDTRRSRGLTDDFASSFSGMMRLIVAP